MFTLKSDQVEQSIFFIHFFAVSVSYIDQIKKKHCQYIEGIKFSQIRPTETDGKVLTQR